MTALTIHLITTYYEWVHEWNTEKAINYAYRLSPRMAHGVFREHIILDIIYCGKRKI